MGLFGSSSKKRPSAGSPPNTASDETDSSEQSQSHMDEEAQEVMAENLDLMYDIVMRLREDPDFASNIYRDCPRLQHLLNERPDLRPIFEDPYLVRLNFEQVYRKAGGKFPEDEEEDSRLKFIKTALVKFVNSPFFKVLRALLLIKKIYSCISGNGFSMIRNIMMRCACCQPELPTSAEGGGNNNGGTGTGGAENALGGDEGDVDAFEGSAHNAELREALYAAAAHMEDPEVAEQMNDLLENDPEGLQEAIENDPDLRALRDSSPLCAELMSDPETMRVLVDPDNLRALGDCPDLIEQDFADPNWTPPDIESGADSGAQTTTTTNAALVADAAVDADADVDVAPEPEGEGELEEGEGEEEEGEEEEEPEFEMEEAEEGDNRQGANKGAAKQKSGGQNQQQNQDGGGGGFFSQVAGGLTNMIAGEIVGMAPTDLLGGGDELGGLEAAADQAADDAATQADSAAASANAVATTASMVPGDDLAALGDQVDAVGTQLDNVEAGMDKMEEVVEDPNSTADRAGQPVQQPTAGQVAGSVVEGAIIFGPCLLPGEEDEKDKQRQDEQPEKKSRFGFLGEFAGAVGTAAKESVLGAVLGSDLAEWAVEKQEEAQEEDDDEEKGDKEKEKGRKAKK